MTNANEQRPAATGNAAGDTADAAAGTAPGAAKPAAGASWTKESDPRRALLTIIATAVVVVAIVLGLGFLVSWGLSAIAVVIMIPGAISLAILAKHPESTGGRSMFGISNPNTLLDPIRRPSERRGK